MERNGIVSDKMHSKKYVYLEAMRIVAIFFVIFNHTGSTGFFLFSKMPVGSVQFWIYLFISVFCKVSVPLFFAISGALMLGKADETLKKLWGQRILKIFILLIIYSFIYYWEEINRLDENFSWYEFFIKMYSSTLKPHLWYMYAFIAYLASLPFLKSLVRTLEEKYYYYMVVISLFFKGFLPVAEYLWYQGNYTLNNNLKISWLITSIVLYPCIGYFIHNKVDINKRIIPVLWVVNILGISLSCYMTYYKGLLTGVLQESESQSFHSSFVVFNCITVFITTKYIFEKLTLSRRAECIILSLGKCTFGIYLLHLLIKDMSFIKSFLNMLISRGINCMFASFMQCLLVLIVGYGITFILIKIPVLKKLVGG